jgi:hypothetical protein
MDYNNPDKKTRFLQQTAMWMVMHPHNNNSSEANVLYPWWNAETIRMCQKIRAYTEKVTHKFVIVNDGGGVVDCLSEYPRMNSTQQFIQYCNNNNISSVVYCGFSHGVCIISEKQFGMKNMQDVHPHIKLYLKHDLTCVGPAGGVSAWKSADELTRVYAEII